MKELLDFILKNILPEGTDYSISQSEDEMGVSFEIKVPIEQRGRVIGKAGKNIKALRDVLNMIAYREKRRIFLKIID